MYTQSDCGSKENDGGRAWYPSQGLLLTEIDARVFIFVWFYLNPYTLFAIRANTGAFQAIYTLAKRVFNLSSVDKILE